MTATHTSATGVGGAPAGAGPMTTITAEIAALQRMSVGQLRERFAQVFGEQPRSWNKLHLFKRVAYKIQEQAYGGLSERAKARAAELVDETLVGRGRRVPIPEPTQPVPPTPEGSKTRDPRLPAVGTVLSKEHGDRTHKVLVREDDFEYEGARFRSLSAIAKKITGAAWNGFLFFALTDRTKKEAK